MRREEPSPRGGEELSGRDRRGQTLALAMTLARFASAGAPPRYCAALRDLGPSKATERALETARDAALQADARKTDFSPASVTRSARRCMRFSASPK